jgi:hypothetical protein
VNDTVINTCEAIGGMIIGRGNQSTLRKFAPDPLCPPQILHDLGLKLGRRAGTSFANHFGYGTAKKPLEFLQNDHKNLPDYTASSPIRL